MRTIAVVLMAALIPALALAGPGVVGDVNGWNPGDPAYLTTVNANGVHVLTKYIAAGTYGYKGIETNAWDGNDFPWNNQSFTLAADGNVTWYVNFGANVGVKQGDEFIFDSTHAPIVCGDFMSELGGNDWDNTNTTLTAMSDPDGDDVWVFVAVIPAGNYQCKVVLNNNWDQDTRLGGANLSFSSDGTTPVMFTYHMANNLTEVSSQVVTLQDVTVTFHLCLSNGIDSFFDVCVTGGHPALTGWGAGVLMGFSCQTASPKLYEVDVMFPAGSDPYVEYKYKKDDCATWESTGNHSFTIDDSAPTQDLGIDGWEYMTPDCPECPTPVESSSWGTIKAMYR